LTPEEALTAATLHGARTAGKSGDFFDAVAMEVRESGASTPAEIGAILGRLGEERGIVIDMTRVPEDGAGLDGM
jgi:hypothetical protein